MEKTDLVVQVIKVLMIIAIILDFCLLTVTVWFGSKAEDKASKVGFSLMELSYVLSILVMLWQVKI